MKFFTTITALFLCAASFSDEDLEQLQKEIEQCKAESEAKISALEAAREDKPDSSNVLERATRDFSFHGYLVGGYGINNEGDTMERFKAPNASGNFRLGNEPDTYLEMAFKKNFMTQTLQENNIDAFAKLMLVYFVPGADNNEYQTTTTIREAYAGMRGLWKEYSEAQVWVGNRYYENLDIHINDTFLRDMSGFGSGIEDIRIGEDVMFAAAWLGGNIAEVNSQGIAYTNDYHFNKNSLDLRLYDIPTPAGSLALSCTISDFSGDVLEAENPADNIIIGDSLGWAVGGILTTPISEIIRSRSALLYGEGAAENFKAIITQPKGIDLSSTSYIPTDDIRRLLITNDILLDDGSTLTYQTTAVFEHYDNGMDSGNIIDWVALGARPVYHFNEFFSLAVEGGVDYTNQKDGPEGTLAKVCIAPQIQPQAAFFSRPSIRLFFSYAVWSDDFTGLVAPRSYGTETEGMSVGIHFETWW